MTKNELRIKSEKEITVQDKIDITNYIVSSCFTQDSEGTLQYTPYLKEVSIVESVVKYCLLGIEFEDEEDIYDSASADEDITKLINDFLGAKVMKDILLNVSDIVDYKKKEHIARLHDESNAVLTYKLIELLETENDKFQAEITATRKLEDWLDAQAEINSIVTPEMQKNFAENFDASSIMDAIISKYNESDNHTKNKELIEANRIIKEKDNKIIQLQNDFAREKQQENVKNVLTPKKR